MLDTWKKAIDEKKVAGAILTGLSKAFDCLNHNLLLAKLNAYGFDNYSLNFIGSYLKERKQRTKVGHSYSTWNELKFGVTQGSILGLLLFNIFLNDIFYFIENSKIANYADNNGAGEGGGGIEYLNVYFISVSSLFVCLVSAYDVTVFFA